MTRYWWVNHKQTHHQEIDGGYLWSPRQEANGARSHYYDNMRLARPGDFVLSMASARIQHVGLVCDRAISSVKPNEFGQSGSNWATDGWLLPIDWALLPKGVRPKAHLDTFARLLRQRYAPIQSLTGNGNQKAYLCEIDEVLFDAVLAAAGAERETLLSQTSIEQSSGQIEALLEARVTESIAMDSSLSATEKVQLQKARLGQGKFRTNVLSIERKCRITGIDNPDLLVASHIKPWRSCRDSNERLDGFNGLMLTPHVDYLFDRGLIGFMNSGELIISSSLRREDMDRMGLLPSFANYSGRFEDAHLPYLGYHRENVFLK